MPGLAAPLPPELPALLPSRMLDVPEKGEAEVLATSEVGLVAREESLEVILM